MNKKPVSQEDEIILEAYNLGWQNCFYDDRTHYLNFKDGSILRTAFDIGWSDYIAGDDVSSVDCQTNEEILETVKRVHKQK